MWWRAIDGVAETETGVTSSGHVMKPDSCPALFLHISATFFISFRQTAQKCTYIWKRFFRYHHHHIYFPIITKITKIAIQSEGCQRSLTAHWLAAQVKKINCPQIILSYNNGANRKQQHCATVIGHVQYHHFIYNNHYSHNT